MAVPTEATLLGVRQLARYVKGNKTLCISAPRQASPNIFLFYTDADHAGNRELQNHCRSQIGSLMLVNGCPTLWKSSVVSITQCTEAIVEQPPAVSVGEAETYAASNGIIEFMHESYVASEFLIKDFPSPIVCLMDSTVAEAFMNNTCTKSKMKHIDVRQNWVKLIRNNSIVVPAHIEAAANLSDWFTKILQKGQFNRNRDAITQCIKLLKAGLQVAQQAALRVKFGTFDSSTLK